MKIIVLLLLAGMSLRILAEDPQEELRKRVQRGGVVLLMRHARTGPGGQGSFDLEDRATQRLLSTEGEQQARRIGRILTKAGVEIGEVRSSRLFRARDTARIAFGEYTTWDVLDALDAPGGPSGSDQETRLREFFAGLQEDQNVVLVTHSPNIQRIAGTFLHEGGLLVLEPEGGGGFRVLGRLDTDAWANHLGILNGPETP